MRGKVKIILGIETSCDETAAAVVRDKTEVLSNIVASQVRLHAKYGGVVPEIASRRHVEAINPVIKEALEQARCAYKDIDAVAVTVGPGLVGALLVGLCAAKAIALSLDLPLIGVNHIEGHLYANFLENPTLRFPLLCLVVSGGHTSLMIVEGDGKVEYVGWTLDDAAGEVLDKVARYLGLGYPGGPIIDRLSQEGDPQAFAFPRPMMDSGDFNFSFSGLKTALIYKVRDDPNLRKEDKVRDLVASFLKAMVDVLVAKSMAAAQEYGLSRIALAGGVAANSLLRSEMKRATEAQSMTFFCPGLPYCTDNAAMIACRAFDLAEETQEQGQRQRDMSLDVFSTLKIPRKHRDKNIM